jgi:hypothetical protein
VTEVLNLLFRKLEPANEKCQPVDIPHQRAIYISIRFLIHLYTRGESGRSWFLFALAIPLPARSCL